MHKMLLHYVSKFKKAHYWLLVSHLTWTAISWMKVLWLLNLIIYPRPPLYAAWSHWRSLPNRKHEYGSQLLQHGAQRGRHVCEVSRHEFLLVSLHTQTLCLLWQGILTTATFGLSSPSTTSTWASQRGTTAFWTTSTATWRVPTRLPPRPHLGQSDHISVFLYPSYRQLLILKATKRPDMTYIDPVPPPSATPPLSSLRMMQQTSDWSPVGRRQTQGRR